MYTVESLTKRFETAFTTKQAQILADAFTTSYRELVKTSDFNELKQIVRDLAEAQQGTELRMKELAEAQQGTELRMKELAEAQQGTELRMKELAQAQQGTELSMDELTHAQQRTEGAMAEMARAVRNMSREVGGLSRGMSYALENEAYRALPDYLDRTYGIKLTDRIVRAEVDEQEINFLARGEQNGQPVYLVGEAKLQIDERRENRRAAYEVFDQLERQVQVVAEHYPEYRIVPLLVTHYARPVVLQQAASRGVIVVQSFEW